MAIILNIETATNVCSVALHKDAKLLAQRISFEEKSHASRLAVFIDEVIKEAKVSTNEIQAVAISKGPGSYTGLRIGVSTAKGIAYGLEIPIISISTLQLMAYAVSLQAESYFEKLAIPKSFIEKALLCPMIDARRMEVYSAIYDWNNVEKVDIQANIISENSFSEIFINNNLLIFGNGAAKCATMLNSEKTIFLPDIYPLADNMGDLAENAFNKQQFEDLAYFEPFYLKDFIAKISTKNMF